MKAACRSRRCRARYCADRSCFGRAQDNPNTRAMWRWIMPGSRRTMTPAPPWPGTAISLIADACHAPGATYKGRKVGTWGHSCFSFHPVKHLTTCEGGMALTDEARGPAYAAFPQSRIDSDHRSRREKRAPMPMTCGSWATITACRMFSAPWAWRIGAAVGWVAARQRIGRIIPPGAAA